jgi:heavy metal sensor kinase
MGLRLRLTLSYAILYLPLLAAVGVISYHTFQSLLHNNAEEALNERWASIKNYLKIDGGKVVWSWDRDDNEDAFLARSIQRVVLVADTNGRIIGMSEIYKKFGAESRQHLRTLANSPAVHRWERKLPEIGTVLFRSGIITDREHQPYLLILGRELGVGENVLNDFARRYFIIMPALVVLLGGIGWFLAGRALRPVNTVASAVQQITGNNLGLRIPRRGANDELDSLIDKFNDMVERLELTFDQTRRFSADVSHELRSPLTMIRGELDVALMSKPNTELYREAMTRSIEGIDSMAKVIRALLQLSQAESGQLVLAQEKLDLSSVARSAGERYGIPAEMGGVQLTVEANSECAITGDRVQMDRLLNNLLSNALKYTPPGGFIGIAARVVDGHPELVVRDSGRGIPEEHLSHIFDRFYRVPDGTSLPDLERGVGLGLSFVAWIAKAHGADVLVDSRVGKGTTFRVRFSQPA